MNRIAFVVLILVHVYLYIYFMYSANADKKSDETDIIISSNGECLWSPYYIETTYCSLDIQWYPFDVQTCRLRYGPWANTKSKVYLKPTFQNISTDIYQISNEWRLLCKRKSCFILKKFYKSSFAYIDA